MDPACWLSFEDGDTMSAGRFVVITSRILVREEDVPMATAQVSEALQSVVQRLPDAQVQEVYNRTERYGRRVRPTDGAGNLSDAIMQGVIDNDAMCEPVELPNDMADEF
jgi:hypothetical protein